MNGISCRGNLIKHFFALLFQRRASDVRTERRQELLCRVLFALMVVATFVQNINLHVFPERTVNIRLLVHFYAHIPGVQDDETECCL